MKLRRRSDRLPSRSGCPLRTGSRRPTASTRDISAAVLQQEVSNQQETAQPSPTSDVRSREAMRRARQSTAQADRGRQDALTIVALGGIEGQRT